MVYQEDIEAKLAEKHITRINGQPTDRDLTLLKQELAKITASVPISLGGGKHRHLGLIIPEDEYVKMSHKNEKFESPMHPGYYPTTVSSIAAMRTNQEAEHKANIVQYKLCTEVKCAC